MHAGAQEAGAVDRFTAIHLNHLEALEVLLEIGIELGELLTHAVIGLPVTALQPKHNQGDGHLREQQQQPQPPLDEQHR